MYICEFDDLTYRKNSLKITFLMFLFCIPLDACADTSKKCFTDQHLCYDIAGVCTCRKGLRFDSEGEECVGEQILVI